MRAPCSHFSHPLRGAGHGILGPFEVTREIGDLGNETWLLSILGTDFLNLDQSAYAKEHLEQSLDIAREIGDRRVETQAILGLGKQFIRQGEYNKALQQYERGIRIADEIEAQTFQCEARMDLARGYLYAGDLPSARTTIDEARRYESEGYNYGLLALVGVITLRTGASDEAQEAFQAAVAQADAQLSYSEQVYGALDSKGLALCGLTLAMEDTGFISPAMDAYRKAREITKDVGIVADVLRLFDSLQEADEEDMLAEVRAVAAGTEVSSI